MGQVGLPCPGSNVLNHFFLLCAHSAALDSIHGYPFFMALYNCSSDLNQAFQIARAIAREYRNDRYGPAHLLKGLLHDDLGFSTVLAFRGKDIHYLRGWAEQRIQKYPKAVRLPENIPGDEQIAKLLEVADVVRLKLSLEEITLLCALAAMCKPGVGFPEDQLRSFPLTEKELLEAELIEQQIPSSGVKKSSGFTGQAQAVSADTVQALSKYCIDKTERARSGKTDPIVGRDREIQELCKILGRRTKPNVIIRGEPGVGKSALVEGFAQRIIEGRVPTYLEQATVLELDVGALIAGASYKGEVEDRLKSIIKALKSYSGRAVLFIDEIHILLDPKGGASGAANLLKPELARGEVTIIGATTGEEYRKYIEKDDAFVRRFDVLQVKEPDREKTLRMLEVLMPLYREHHLLDTEPEALSAAVDFAMRYFKERQLPDSAIDLLDKTMAAVRMMKDTSSMEITLLTAELELLRAKCESAGQWESIRELKWLDTQIRDRVSPIMIGRLKDTRDVGAMESTEPLLEYLSSNLSELTELLDEGKTSINADDIGAVVAYATGIPLGKIQSDEKEKLQHMLQFLRGRVVGQDHALETIVNAVRVSRAGLSDSRRPIGSFFLLGPTGTGKTELAKSVAEFLFNDERALIRFDMSEFTEKHTAQFLIGAPPGYVGYEEGGALVNEIRRQPYSIVLFDEIEKAHPEVFKTFLQILDDGKLSDKLGKEGDFSNAIILFTSNIGSDYIVEKFSAGEIPDQQELIQAMGKYFKDEFLGRLTEIIPFAPISEQHIVDIFSIQLKPLTKALERQGLDFEVTGQAMQYLANKGFSPRFGARPLRRVIASELQKPISKMMVEGRAVPGHKIVCDLVEGELVISVS